MAERARRRRRPRPEPQVIHPDEHRWNRHRLTGTGRLAVNATATPLDAYHYARIITDAQYHAGDQLRDTWEAAGRAPSLTSTYELTGGGDGEMSDAQARAWERFSRAVKPLMPIHRSLVVDVCCHGQAAEIWARWAGQPPHLGLLMLRDALDVLGRSG